MKKMNRFSIAGLLAAGAMLFATLGCDTAVSEKEWADEIPTTWYSYSSSGNGTCTAKWTFATDKASIGSSETSWTGKTIAPDIGEGATLTGGDPCAIKYVAPSSTVTLTEDMGVSTGRIQAANKTASLDSLDNSAYFVLETKSQTNITVRAKGAGAATAARILVITDADGEKLVYKDNLYSEGSKYTAFHVQGAPAGKYNIYFNGSTIVEIDCNATDNDVSEPKAYTSNEDVFIVNGSYTAVSASEKGVFDYDTSKFKVSGDTAETISHWLENGYLAYDVTEAGSSDKKASVNFYAAYSTATMEGLVGTQLLALFDKDNNNVTNDAAWTSSDNSIATVSKGVVTAIGTGTATIRARIGRFYKEVDVNVTEPKHTLVTTYNEKNIPAASKKLSELDANALKALNSVSVSGLASPLVELVEEEATIAYGEENEVPAAESGDNRVSKGPGIGISYKSGSTNSEIGAKFVTFTFKVRPASGKSPKLDGVTGILNCGKGSKVLGVQAYINDERKGSHLNITKNNLVSYNNIGTPAGTDKATTDNDATVYGNFGEGVSISGETTIDLVVEVIGSGKKEISLQIQDIGLTFSE